MGNCTSILALYIPVSICIVEAEKGPSSAVNRTHRDAFSLKGKWKSGFFESARIAVFGVRVFLEDIEGFLGGSSKD